MSQAAQARQRASIRSLPWPMLLAATAVVASGCLQPNGTNQGGPPLAAFPPGIYHLEPSVGDWGPARLVHLDGAAIPYIEVMPVGYDLQPQRLIYGDSDRHLFVVGPDGSVQEVRLQSIHSVGRPTLSPDGRHAAVQALEGDARIGTPSENLDIHIVDLATGASRRVSHLPINEESPVWIPGTRHVTYSSFDADDGVHLHIVDADTGEAVRTIRDAGELHVSVSDDGDRFVQGPMLRVYDMADGALVADLLGPALDGLRAAGYEPAPNRGGNPGQDAFPLSADLSPDGRDLVVDGAVVRDGQEGMLIVRIGLDGTGFQVLSDLIPVDPTMDNEHNFSQVDPRWV